jgi:predicted extracellular nuclease
MKFQFSILLVLFLCFSCQSQVEDDKTEKRTSSTVRTPIELLKDFEGHPVIFYNVQNLFDTLDTPGKNDVEFTPAGSKKWDTQKYNDKLHKLAEVLSFPENHRPLFIGLAEVENLPVVIDVLKTAPLDQSTYRVAHFESPDNRGIDVALGYDVQRFYLEYKEAITIEGLNYPTRDILYVKGFLKDSMELHVFVNHWTSRMGGVEKSEIKRIAAARTLRKKVDSLLAIDENSNVLIMGDFNDEPDDLSISSTLKVKKPTAKLKPTDLVNLSYEPYQQGKGTYVYEGQWDMLDQLIVSQGLFDSVNQLIVKDKLQHLVYDESEDFIFQNESHPPRPNRTYGRGDVYYGGYSDHLAIYLYLERAKQ